MLRRTIALTLLVAAAALPAAAANTAYDRAASMATGETALGRGYDGAKAAGAVKASVNGTLANGALITSGSAPNSLTHAAMNAAPVPTPDKGFLGDDSAARRIGFGASGAVMGAVAGGALGGPIGALLGAALGFGIALMLSKLLG
ncbi:MAG: hypothetical protein A2506_05535 [Elusimicrobia bacterium RIFOXYD12_FULL_66_9]|nr:MAG: hypothetical protein A2506_05535 [Elusimicrobia bacterium RIFOXYD12_FULL_66_9]